MCEAVTSIVRLSLTSHWTDRGETTCGGRRHTRSRAPGAEHPSFALFSSVQVEAVPPVQKRAVCIQTAGCYGQSGNGGQGTDRGRGSRPVDSHHPHHGELPSAERLVPHSRGDNRTGRDGPSRTAQTCGHAALKGERARSRSLETRFEAFVWWFCAPNASRASVAVWTWSSARFYGACRRPSRCFR